jgi:carbonic anhydrase
LKQLHVHTPSEHYVNGRFYPMEIHFVHAHADGSLLVVGVLFDVQAWPSRFLEAWPAVSKQSSTTDVQFSSGSITKIDPAAICLDSLKKELNGFASGIYAYKGSLTTPPCTENVQWIVANDVARINAEQFRRIRDHLQFNARPLQR